MAHELQDVCYRINGFSVFFPVNYYTRFNFGNFFLGLSDFVAVQEKKFAVLLNSLILAKCFRCRLWENSLHVSKQLEKIGRY